MIITSSILQYISFFILKFKGKIACRKILASHDLFRSELHRTFTVIFVGKGYTARIIIGWIVYDYRLPVLRSAPDTVCITRTFSNGKICYRDAAFLIILQTIG